MSEGVDDVRPLIHAALRLTVRKLRTGTRCRIHHCHGADFGADVRYLGRRALPCALHKGVGHEGDSKSYGPPSSRNQALGWPTSVLAFQRVVTGRIGVLLLARWSSTKPVPPLTPNGLSLSYDEKIFASAFAASRCSFCAFFLWSF